MGIKTTVNLMRGTACHICQDPAMYDDLFENIGTEDVKLKVRPSNMDEYETDI